MTATVWELGGEVFGNNAAAACPACSKVYLCSAFSRASAERDCPHCGGSRITITKRQDGTRDKHGCLYEAVMAKPGAT